MLDFFVQAAHAAANTASDAVTEMSIRAIDWFTWLWVIGISSMGGAVSFYQKLKQGQARPFNFAELLGEIVGSAFVGIITFLLCKNYGFNELITAALVGITGHMGSRAMMLFERVLERKLNPNA